MDDTAAAPSVTQPGPIFVAGLDHSGKTALRRALGMHPDIRMVRHVELWTRLAGWHAAGAPGRQRALDALTSGKAARLGLDRQALAAAASDGNFAVLVREIGRQLGEQAGARRWGLQEALLEFQAMRILQAMPEARIVCVVRDPRSRYREMLDDHAVGRGGLAAETAAWVASVSVAREAAAARPEAVLVVRNEMLRTEPEGTLREICDFIGEPFSAAMLHELPPPEEQPPLPDKDIAFIQDRAATQMAALEYELLPIPQQPAMLPQRLADASRWQLGRLAWRRRSRHLDPSFAAEGK
ncbi:MAG TPA: sulfotransferase [Candidatus Limnocylindria bacterium]|jgi:hypothetical protein